MLITDIENLISSTWCAQYPEYTAIIVLFVICLLIYTYGSALHSLLKL